MNKDSRIFGTTSLESEKEYLVLIINTIKNRINFLAHSIGIRKKENDELFNEAKGKSKSELRVLADDVNLGRDFLHREKEELTELENSTRSPYFARLDFRDTDNTENVLYISKYHSLHTDSYDVLYSNWRAPICDLYYRYNGKPLRNVSYKVNKNIISGDIVLTAEHKIEDSQLIEFTFSSLQDDVSVTTLREKSLQDKLADTSSAHMHEIIETIQSEQNEIIRYSPTKNIIIQGVAGSGKTQVALHRIAYLMYKNEDQSGLTSDEVLIVSPNDEFSDYISHVLPELEGVKIPMETLERLCKQYLFTKDVEDFGSFIERFYQTGKKDAHISYKLNDVDLTKFIETIKAYSNENTNPRMSDIPRINELKEEKIKIEKRLEQIKDEFKDSFSDLGENRVHRWLQDGFAPKNPPPIESMYTETRRRQERERDVYRELVVLLGRADLTGRVLNDIVSLGKYYKTIDRIKAASFGIFMQEGDKKSFYQGLFEKNIGVINEDGIIHYEDEQFFLAMRFALQGNTAIHSGDGYWFIKQDNLKIVNNKIRHIVIDEAQDYTPMQIWLIAQMFPRAIFTILGDRNQNVNPYFIHKTLNGILVDAEYFEINNAYRSSPEIIEYTNKILNLDGINSVRKSQNHPVEEKIVSGINIDELSKDIKNLRNNGFNRIAIITKSNDVAERISKQRKTFDDGVHILPVYKAKGLEYDAVIVTANYSENEKELFYTACTRAQHKLIVYKKNT